MVNLFTTHLLQFVEVSLAMPWLLRVEVPFCKVGIKGGHLPAGC
jgi:hypothetical protein